jgi:cell division protein FtsB
MSPRRPNAPHAGAASARAAGRPPAPRPTTPRPAAARSAPAGRASASDRPPSAGRASSRPLPGVPTPPAGVASPSGRVRPPLIRPVTMVSGVLAVVALLLAPYIRPWVAQRSQLAEGRREVAALQQQVNDLTAETRRWQDPAYVRAQARERLDFVMPGETSYVVLDDTAEPSEPPDPRSVAAALPAGSDSRVWYSKVWDSITIAGDPTTEQARTATTP